MSQKNHQTSSHGSPNSILCSVTGPLIIPMTNDYLFRALLQRSNTVLKGLICSLLHLTMEEILSVTIANPIELGKTIDDKTFILDVKVLMNSHTIINLEMQVINEYNWTDRSLSYLCRSFDHLKAGVSYQSAHSIIQIGLLNFTLFPSHPEFYATYQFLNVKNYTLYSDKMRLSVIDLTRKDLATEEDRSYQIDKWASLFKATTWEELYMLAQTNECIKEAAETIYQITQEEQIRQQCEAREDYYRRQLGMAEMLENQANTLMEKDAIIKRQENTIKEQAATIQKQGDIIQKQGDTIKEQSMDIAQLQNSFASVQEQINSLRQGFASLHNESAQKQLPQKPLQR